MRGSRVSRPTSRGQTSAFERRNMTRITTFNLPAPVGGWNALEPLANMPATDAIILDNLYPQVDAVVLRDGEFQYASNVGSSWIEAFIDYHSPTANSLFACSDAGIWDVTTGGVKGAAATACTDGDWSSVNITTSGGSYLIAVNGTDAAKLYNGAAWSATTITGVSDAALNNVVLHKNRLWFVQKNTNDVWYLPTQSIGGAATKFPMGPLFTRGGHIVAQFVWTIDGGTGLDDYLVTVTSEGEMAVYQGTDPASSTTWALVGVYYVGRPLGKRCFCKYGGDVIYTSTRGIFKLSELLLAVWPNRQISLSGKIDNAFREMATSYQTYDGWQTLIYPAEDAILVNIPLAPNTAYNQFVMNDLSKAWCRFTGWNFRSLIVFNEVLYGGGNGDVHQLWVGGTDTNVPIVGTVSQAYALLGTSQQKQIELIKPIVQIAGNPTILLCIDGDFQQLSSTSTFGYTVTGTLPLWDQGMWDVSLWDGTPVNYESVWTAVPNNQAVMQSLRMQITASNSVFKWVATYFAYQASKSGNIL